MDLASKFSAGMVVDQDSQVLCEFDSWKINQLQLVDVCIALAKKWEVDMVMVEDLPYGLSKQFQTKPATRLQGMFIKEFHNHDLLDKLYFVNPSTWQHELKVFKAGKDAARLKAEELGFEQRLPIEKYADLIPPLGKEHAKARAAVRSQLKKASTDYDDAFLIGHWTIQKLKEGTLETYKGVQQYEG